jgi:hypothetical protein
MTPREPEGPVWFANRGQILQLVVACIACVFAGTKAWPEMKQNEFLSAGALLFYALVALVLISAGTILNAARKGRSVLTRAPAAENHLEAAIVRQLWTAWAGVGDMYERLDYDNRDNSSTRFPFHPGSWPGFGERWTHVNVQLFKNADVVGVLKRHTEGLLGSGALGWNDYSLPRTEETVVMVDFIRDIREFQAYLDRKLRAV